MPTRARALRRGGMSVPAIAHRLDVDESSVSALAFLRARGYVTQSVRLKKTVRERSGVGS